MDNFFMNLSRLNLAYIIGQIVLLPVYIFYFIASCKCLKINSRAIIHKSLLFFSIFLPLILIVGFNQLFREIDRVFLSTLMDSIKLNFYCGHLRNFPWYILQGIMNIIGLLALMFQIIKQQFIELTIKNHNKTNKIGRITFIVSDQIISPFSTGIFKPTIYLPDRLRSRRLEQRIVIQHEAFHIREKHILKNLIEISFKYLFWFNPVVHLMTQYGQQLREELCDRHMSRKFTPRVYSWFLVNEAEECLIFRNTVLANAFKGNNTSLKKRILYIWGDNP